MGLNLKSCGFYGRGTQQTNLMRIWGIYLHSSILLFVYIDSYGMIVMCDTLTQTSHRVLRERER